MIVNLPYNISLRPYQIPIWNAFFKEKKKRAICVWHRRAGKDKTFINIIIGAALQRKGNYIYLFPTHKQARLAIWRGIDKYGLSFLDHFPRNVLKGEPHNTEMYAEFINGSTFQLLGSDNYNNLMGTPPVGFVFSEFSLQNPRAYEYFQPILAENDGWALFQGTPRGMNHLYDMYQVALNDPSWFCQFLTVEDTKDNKGNPVISEETIEKLRKEGMPEEMVQQEFYCSFTSANVGAYFGKYMEKAEVEGRVRDFEIDSNIPVHTFWDLGMKDSTSIWWMQPIKDELRLIYYFEDTKEGSPYYANILKEIEKKLNIKYGYHFAPFDIKTHEWGTGKTRIQQALENGISFKQVPKLGKIDGINYARRLFPRCVFHQTNCKHGIRCLKEYKKRYNEILKCYSESPERNWATHGADAFRYMCVGWGDYYNSNYFNPNVADSGRRLPPIPI